MSGTWERYKRLHKRGGDDDKEEEDKQGQIPVEPFLELAGFFLGFDTQFDIFPINAFS